MNIDRLLKLLSMISLLFIISYLYLIAITPPTVGYELSIYDAYPWFFWMFLTGSIVSGIIILVHQAFYGKDKSKWWLVGFSIILFTTFIFLLLPLFRGYAFYDRGDVLDQYGMVKDVIFTGHIGRNNPYPISHILVVSTSYITGLTPRVIILSFPAFFSILYMILIYLLATVISRDHGQILLITAFGSVLIFIRFNTAFYPSILSFFIFPLIIFLYYMRSKKGSITYEFIFILMLFLIPFFYPTASLYLIIILLCFGLSTKILKSTQGQKSLSEEEMYRFGSFQVPSMILFITFFTWLSSHAIFGAGIRKVYNWLVYGLGRPPIEDITTMLASAHLSIYEQISLFINLSGHHLLFLLVSLIAIIVLLKNFFSSHNPPSFEELSFSLLFIIFSVITIIVLISYLIENEPFRIFQYALLFSTLLNGIFLYNFISKLKGKKKLIAIILLLLLIIISSFIGIFNVYPSPIIRQANEQVTVMELVGMEWFINQKSLDIDTSSIKVYQRSFEAAIHSYETMEQEKRTTHWKKMAPPVHFGYDNNNTLGETFTSDRYILLSEMDYKFYGKLWPEVGKWSLDDFKKFDSDSTVDKLYSNGELKIWLVGDHE